MQQALRDINLEEIPTGTEILDTPITENPDAAPPESQSLALSEGQPTTTENSQKATTQEFVKHFEEWKRNPSETAIKVKPNVTGKL